MFVATEVAPGLGNTSCGGAGRSCGKQAGLGELQAPATRTKHNDAQYKGRRALAGFIIVKMITHTLIRGIPKNT